MMAPRKMSRQQEMDASFAALGRFVAAHSKAVAAVHVLARHLSGAPDEKARAIFDRMNPRPVMDCTRALLALSDLTETDIETATACLTQLQLIGDGRNSAAHSLAMATSDGVWLSNLFTAPERRRRSTDYTLRDLENMRQDCEVIFVRLGVLTEHGGLVRMSAAARAALRAPWRYKLPQPARSN